MLNREGDSEGDDEPVSEVAKKKKETEARDARKREEMEQVNQILKDEKAQKLKDEKACELKDKKDRLALLVVAARNSEQSSVNPRSRSSCQSIFNAPGSQQKKGSIRC